MSNLRVLPDGAPTVAAMIYAFSDVDWTRRRIAAMERKAHYIGSNDCFDLAATNDRFVAKLTGYRGHLHIDEAAL